MSKPLLNPDGTRLTPEQKEDHARELRQLWYHRQHKSYLRGKARAWGANNPEKRRASKKLYYGKNKERILANYKIYRNGNAKILFGECRRSAIRRELEFGITLEFFISMWGKPCHYCCGPTDKTRLDRVDNGLGYTEANVVPCCKFCNYAKGTLTVREFLDNCARVVAHNNIGRQANG